MTTDPHAVYILGSYLGVATLTLALVAAVVLDARRQATRLKNLEARTLRRRPAGTDQ